MGPGGSASQRCHKEGGVAVFRTADRALRLLGRFCAHRLAWRDAATPASANEPPAPVPV